MGVVLTALAASVAHASPAAETAPEHAKAQAKQPRLIEQKSETQNPWDRFTMYRPNYFITGVTDGTHGEMHGDVKFQVSVRYEILADRPRLWHLLLAYTQKSFWNIYDQSAPFRENNYNPELFVQWHPKEAPAHYLKAGYAHESNGMAGDPSRSWDRVFAEARISLGALTLYPTIWWPFLLSDNPTILRSFGFGALTARLRFSANIEMETVARVGNLFDRGSVLAGLNVGSVFEPLGIAEQKWFTPRVYLQIWYGYGESMIDFDERSAAARIGFMLRE